MIEKILTNVKWHQLKKVIPDDQIVIDKMITGKINELCDAVNELDKHLLFLRKKVLEITYKEPDQYKSITFMSDGHIKKFYGHDSIVELEVPLPQGTKITIISIAKGGNNE